MHYHSKGNYGNLASTPNLQVNIAEEYASEYYWWETFSDLPSDEIIWEALELLAVTKAEGNNWIIDSGASKHFSGDYSTFSNVDRSQSSSVAFASGQSHVIAGQNTIDLSLPNGEIKSLKDIRYVPGLHRNILSVGQITDMGNLCIFSRTECSVVSIQKQHKIVAKGIQDGHIHASKYNTCPS